MSNKKGWETIQSSSLLNSYHMHLSSSRIKPRPLPAGEQDIVLQGGGREIEKDTHTHFFKFLSKQETITVQAPQPPSPHPNFVPVRPMSLLPKQWKHNQMLPHEEK